MQICEKELCCGCSACEAACPASAITMVADEEGFLRPAVDSIKCINCGLCQKKCPVNTKNPSLAGAVYAAYSKNKEIRERSSSGGVFFTIATEVIKNGGVVFGAGFDKDMKVCHYSAENNEDLYKLMGSKYVQSDMRDTFKKMADLLKEGREVLFSGSPCQCAGARNLFGNHENLILMDFVCHGVPTPKIWDKYLKDNFCGVTGASFRDKSLGWEEFSMRVDSSDGKYICSRYKDPYIRLFLANVTLRPSCYNCSWKDPNFCADITIGDFWGISKVDPALNDNKGTSVVVVRTEKGKKLTDLLKENCYVYETEAERSMSSNGMYTSSTPMNNRRKLFFEKLLADVPFEELKSEFAKTEPTAVIIKIRIKQKLKLLLCKLARIKRK